MLKLGAAVLPIVTLGLAAGPLIGVVAIVRRSVRLGAAAVVYLAATITGFSMIDTSTDVVTSTRDGLGVSLVILTALACSIQAAIIIPRRIASANPELHLRRRTPGRSPPNTRRSPGNSVSAGPICRTSSTTAA